MKIWIQQHKNIWKPIQYAKVLCWDLVCSFLEKHWTSSGQHLRNYHLQVDSSGLNKMWSWFDIVFPQRLEGKINPCSGLPVSQVLQLFKWHIHFAKHLSFSSKTSKIVGGWCMSNKKHQASNQHFNQWSSKPFITPAATFKAEAAIRSSLARWSPSNEMFLGNLGQIYGV